MKTLIKISILIFVVTVSFSSTFAQVKVESDGSLYVNSYAGNYARANWTKVHNQYSCAYQLWNTYYNRDVFYVRGDGVVCYYGGLYNYSDSTLKTNIQGIDSSLEKIKMLHGVTYNRRNYIKTSVPIDPNMPSSSGLTKNVIVEELEPTEYGLIAQEVEKIVPEAVKTMHDSLKAVSYTSIIPILIEAIKEQQKQIESMQRTINEHEEEILILNSCCENSDSSLKSASMNTGAEEESNFNDALLYQNTPNPFTKNTEIKYSIPNTFNSATIFIHNLQGMEIKAFQLNGSGTNSVIINGSELEPGLYLYTLVVNQKIVDTKKMLLTKN